MVMEEITQELESGARSESDYLWLIADRAVLIHEKCRIRKMDIAHSDIMSAIAHYCRKSATRVKRIFEVGVLFHANIRKRIEEKYGYWEFGYYERMCSTPYAWQDLFEFLSMYDKGELVTPGRHLGVGEFIFLYEAHIEGKTHGGGYNASSKIYAGRVAFNAVINASRNLKIRLMIHMGKGPAVDRTLELINELEKVAPKAMEELGFSISVDNKEKVRV